MNPPLPQTDAALDRASDITEAITIRVSRPDDRAAILRLAELDGRRPPAGDAILAIVGGELQAALPLEGGDGIADPFRRTIELVELLRVRRASLHDTGASGLRAFGARIVALRARRPAPTMRSPRPAPRSV